MDNEQIAKIVLSIILDTKVLSLQSKPQETPLSFSGGYGVSRFDFKAIIHNENGEDKTVLIEIQKYKSPNPVVRFRQYLAKNYMREETFVAKNGEEETKSLPIISIYILGFDLPEFVCKAVKVDNKPYDIIGRKYLEVKSNFVEQLTHQCFILFAADKPDAEKKNTRLEQFLNLFLQKLEGEAANTVIDVEVDTASDAEMQSVVEHLNHATLDEELIRRINAEKDHLKGIEDLEKQVAIEQRLKEEAQQREAEAQREKAEAQREKVEAQREKVEAQHEKVEAQREKVEAQKRELEAQKKLINTVKKLHDKSMSNEDIAELTGEPVETIHSILSMK